MKKIVFLLVMSALSFSSCVKNDVDPNNPITSGSKDSEEKKVSRTNSEYVMGTSIPASALKKNVKISDEVFRKQTEGKYFFVVERYCCWKGDTLQYLQTGDDFYGLEGIHNMRNYSGTNYIQFEDSIMHFYNDLFMWDDRYIFTYNEKERVMTIPIKKTKELHCCRVDYIDENYIVGETDVYQHYYTTLESSRAASHADFVQLLFIAVEPPEYFADYTDWEVRYPEGN